MLLRSTIRKLNIRAPRDIDIHRFMDARRADIIQLKGTSFQKGASYSAKYAEMEAIMNCGAAVCLLDWIGNAAAGLAIFRAALTNNPQGKTGTR